MELHTVLIGLGSNLGDRETHLEQARLRLQRLSSTPLRTSGIYECKAVGGEEDAPLYLNQVVEIQTHLDPETLLYTLKGFERVLGRRSRERWFSREIDMDVLLYDNQILDFGRYKIPHPGLVDRQFVLRPMCDLSPRRVHPVEGVSMEEMLRGLVRFEGDQILRLVIAGNV
jgi:2-amino-4-hydroxy-6-hydroxymethyldihydropteridine diphosphokinase